MQQGLETDTSREMSAHYVAAKIVSVVLVLAASCFPPRCAFADPPYVVFDLGTLGGESSSGSGVNNCGTVVGSAQNARDIYRAFSWTISGGQRYLGTLGQRSMAFAINESDVITGTSYLTDAIPHAFRWDPVRGMQDLGTLGGLISEGRDVNERGQIVGYSKLPGSNYSRPFLWQTATGMRDLGTLPGHPVGYADAINDVGVVVGESCPSTLNLSHAVMWDAGGNIVDIGGFGHHTAASDINNVGQVVGSWYDTDGGTYWNAFLWTAAGGRVDLPELDDGSAVVFTFAYAINDLGEVVGESAGWACIWDETNGVRNLDDLIPQDSGWDLLYASDINDNGWIVGQGWNPAGEQHGYLLVPEPATVALLALGWLWVMRRPGQPRERSGREPDGPIMRAGRKSARSRSPDFRPRGVGLSALHERGAAEAKPTPTSRFLEVNCGRAQPGQRGRVHMKWATRVVVDLGLVVLVCPAGWAVPPAYEVNIIPSLGGDSSYAHDINNLCQVAGQASTADDTSRAFVWQDGQMQGLEPLPGGNGCWAHAINDLGQVVGASRTTASWTPSTAVLWAPDGTPVDLGRGKTDTIAHDINEAGVAVGADEMWWEAFRWADAGMDVLPDLGGEGALAVAINDTGRIAGAAKNNAGWFEVAIWEGGQVMGLGFGGVAEDINALGQICGTKDGAGAFLWDPVEGLQLLESGGADQARGLNDQGQVVGYYYRQSVQIACLWESGHGYDLNAMIPPDSGIHLLEAEAINEAGWIVGRGVMSYETRGFVLKPVPEPATLSLLALSVLAVLRRHRRT